MSDASHVRQIQTELKHDLRLSVSLSDAGKSLPEALDYSVFWLQTVAGEADSRTGIPPPLLSVVIRDFLTGPGEFKRFRSDQTFSVCVCVCVCVCVRA